MNSAVPGWKVDLHPSAVARKLLQRAKNLIPVSGFHFDRPLVIFQSDDWGRVGVRDREGVEHLRSAGLSIGEHPYDSYSLETADDVVALVETLNRHRDSAGRHPCIELNFVLGNLDFGRMEAEGWREIFIRPLTEGLPAGWMRPGLNDAYRAGITDGVLRPALHGITHFCRPAVERNLAAGGERAELLRNLWRAGTPYIHWRMPWAGYEYWDPEESIEDRFLEPALQRDMIAQAVGMFTKMFSMLPASACAPGYRANDDTVRAWVQHGIKVAQNGPKLLFPPHFDSHEVLQLFRNLEFEPAVNPNFSLEECLCAVENAFERGVPAIVSVHSINFHSTIKDFRTRTLTLLDEFLTKLERKHTDLLYVHDVELREFVRYGSCDTAQGNVTVNVTKKRFTKTLIA